jgi:UDP-glucose 4-epimerase
MDLTTRISQIVLDEQFYGDVRTMSLKMLSGYDAIVQLAAVSNDPMGNQFETEAGVKNFVLHRAAASTALQRGPRKETDPLNPITAYAKSKIGTERELLKIDSEMVVTCLRFATACGMSDRLRLDLVLNDFVACALSIGEITVLSDGSPWRPLIDVADMVRAIDWAIERTREQWRPLSCGQRRCK